MGDCAVNPPLPDGSEAEFYLMERALRVGPVFRKVDFDRLLEVVNEDNLHELVDFGVPRGREIW